jgi:spermidine synthase
MAGTSGAGSPRRANVPDRFVLLLVAACGAATMCVELAAVRALQPFFGSSSYVWANVFAVVLGALALGALLGGVLADRRADAALLSGLAAAGGLASAVSALVATPVARSFVDPSIDAAGAVSVLLKGSLGAALVVFAPPLVLAGMVTPVAVKLLAAKGVGGAAGRVLAVSTASALAGAYATTHVLVPALGSRPALFAAAALVVAPGALGLGLLGGQRGVFAGAAAAATLSMLAAFADAAPNRGAPLLANSGVARVLEERESAYQYLTVREDTYPNGEVDQVLTINEGVRVFHALKVRGRVLTDSRHYDDYTVLPFLVDVPRGGDLRIGIVGFACGVNAGQLRHFWKDAFRLTVEGAEIDPEVVALGRRHFALPADDPALRVTIADGRTWLAAASKGGPFHALAIDAFANEAYMPFHLATREFLAICRERLAPGGVLAVNAYAVGADAPNLAALEQTIAAVFGHCVRSSRYRDSGFLLLARNGDAPPDTERLRPWNVRERFGDRQGVPEWDWLANLASEVADDVTIVTPRADALVLTDDHAPLEHLTDRFLAQVEQRVLTEDGGAGEFAHGVDLAVRESALSGRSAALRALSRRQTRWLWGIASAWAAVAAAALLAVRRARI